ncbi:MAG TPA: hypothetical protein VFA87_07745 [Rhizomicrobium sp.]|nr:hypothetical protein [Rhizomicrobium sp.]
MMKARFGNRAHRAVSILLVLILHALLVLALLRFMVRPQNSAFREAPQPRLFEMMINTARLPAPRTRKGAPRPAPARAAVEPAPQIPLRAEPLSPTPDIRGFGQALADCAPEKVANLAEAQRSQCRKFGALPSYDPSAVDYADHSVPGAKRWARELARKNAPLLLPCGNSRAADPVYTGACIIANIANGFTFKQQYENQPGYSDKSGN